MKIAFLEDDKAFANSVAQWLQEAGHEVTLFANGRDCQRALTQGQGRYDLCLFDWELPDMSGTDVMASLQLKRILPPVIFLTGHDAEEDVVKVMHAGADDYIVKPPSRALLLARIHALSRRANEQNQPAKVEDFGYLKVDYVRRLFEKDGKEVSLTEKETELALYFFSHIGELLTRPHLIQVVWGSSPEIDTRRIDVHISHLRSKLNLVPEKGWRLSSIYQQGYRLERFS
ncbi:Sensory transduction protein regX3 [Methylophilaceae bacterium]|nr:Sensory transduction protein regX3 [Methylophilaceae bacterium]